MNIEFYRDYCLNLKAVSEHFPFDANTLVFKVGGKMFALCDVNQFESINLKCDPERAIELRELYPESIKPGYHMSKKHWNTIEMDGSINDKLILELINHSYDLVLKSLPKKVQEEILNS